MANCRKCNEEILFAKTEKGKWIPLNIQRSSNGNIDYDEDTNTGKVLGSPTGDLLHVSHFATCPGAAEFRRS